MVNLTLQDQAFRIGVLLVDDFPLLAYASLVEPLRAANVLSGKVLYHIRHLPALGDLAQSSGHSYLKASAAVGIDFDFDLVLVVAGGNPATFQDTRVFNWLRRLSRFGVPLGGVSGGPVILAAAGLMTGRRMTVHWAHAASLAEDHPGLLIEQSLYVIDRDRLTCAGGTAPMDMMHALLSEHHGSAFSRQVSDWLLHIDIRPSEGPQRSGLIERYGTTNRAVLDAIEAMQNHIGDPISLQQLSIFSKVSVRQLNRLFREKLGLTTMAFYRQLRLEKAQNLLTHSTLSVTDIAIVTGFISSAHFASAHGKHFGITPSEYRDAKVKSFFKS